MAYNSKKGYDPDLDYSTALQNPNLTAAERSQLVTERQAKINDVYGGVEPTYGDTGKTYSALYGYGTGAGASGGGGNAKYGGAGASGYDENPNFDYSTYMDNLMKGQSTDYDYLERLLNERTNKAVSTTGLGQYANDDFAQSVRDYISKGRETQYANDLGRMDAYYQSMLDDLAREYTPPSRTPSEWDETKNALARAALEMNFDDWTQSDQYAALANRYGRTGKLMMQDLLGQISSRTGGLASSYAATAAQQQYNEYMARLEEEARAAYANERNAAIQNAQMAYDFADSDYQRYLDELAQYNTDRNYAFDVLSRALEQSNYAREWANAREEQAYQRQRDSLADSRYDDETAFSRGKYEDETAYKRALEKAETLAAAGDFSGYAALGYTDAEIARLKEMYDREQAAMALTGSSGKSSGGRSSGSSRSSSSSGASGGVAGVTGNRTSFDYNEDEGIFRWNGKSYTNPDDLLNDIDAANLTASEKNQLKEKFKLFGFNISF